MSNAEVRGIMRLMAKRQPRRSTGRAPLRGQSLVEMALMMPLFLVMLVGAVDFSQAFFYHMRLTNAVRAGAIYGISAPSSIEPSFCSSHGLFCDNPNNIKFRIKNEGNLGLTDGDITVTCYADRSATVLRGASPNLGDCSPASGVQSGDTIQVTAVYTFRPLTGQMGLLPSSYTMRKTIRMVIL